MNVCESFRVESVVENKQTKIKINLVEEGRESETKQVVAVSFALVGSRFEPSITFKVGVR